MIEPRLLVSAYREGVFPMALDGGEIGWFSPDPRGILPLDGFIVSARLARVVRQQKFEIRIDTAFEDVMRACATRPDDGTWISEEIVESYVALHRLGGAHSVRSVAGRQTRRRPVRRAHRRRILRRVDVSSRDRRIQGRAGRIGGSASSERIPPLGYSVDDAAPRAVRRDRDPKTRLRAATYARDCRTMRVRRGAGEECVNR